MSSTHYKLRGAANDVAGSVMEREADILTDTLE